MAKRRVSRKSRRPRRRRRTSRNKRIPRSPYDGNISRIIYKQTAMTFVGANGGGIVRVYWGHGFSAGPGAFDISMHNVAEHIKFANNFAQYRVIGCKITIRPHIIMGSTAAALTLLDTGSASDLRLPAGAAYMSTPQMRSRDDYKSGSGLKVMKKYIGVRKFQDRQNLDRWVDVGANYNDAHTQFSTEAAGYGEGNGIATVDVRWYVQYKSFNNFVLP